MRSISVPFYICISAIFIAIVSPALFSEGMFMDGLIYATIARNLAEGIGSFWYLKFSETWFSSFHEHPPLAFRLQSIFFQIFGDQLWVERVYSIFTFFVTAYVITLIWKRVTESKYHVLAWLPLVFMTSIPLVTWAAANNMLENTMMVFATLSIFCMLKSFGQYRYLYLALAGISLFLAFLTKGFTALFPLSFFFWVFVFRKEFGFMHFVSFSFILFVFFLLPFLLLTIFYYEAIESLITYFQIQVANSLNNIVTVETRFFILIRLLKELIPAFILIVFIRLIFKFKLKKAIKFSIYSNLWIMLGLALSGVLPIMVSMKQSGFYILSTFSLFSIVLAMFVAPYVLYWTEKINVKSNSFSLFKKIAALILIISICFAYAQSYRLGRDKAMLTDIKKIIKIVPPNTTITIDENLWDNWSLYGYFHRYAKISLDTQNEHEILLLAKETEVREGYLKVDLELQKFDLYKLK